MAINFPDSPSIGDTYTSGGRTWQWDGSVWSGYGNFVDPSILKIDTVNNRVGVNNVSPAADLDVTGNISVSSDVTVQGNLAVGSIVDVESNISTIESNVSTAQSDISNLETRPVETKTASYTLVAGDVNKRIVMNSAGATTITVNDSVFAAGDTVWIHNIGAGTTTVTAGTATVNTAGSLDVGQWEGGSLYFTSASSAIFFRGGGAGVANANFTDTATGTFSSGGTNYKYLIFTSSGTVTFDTDGLADFLVVAGGGAGNKGNSNPGQGCGGGGAGGVLEYLGFYVTAGTYTVTVGAGASYTSNYGHNNCGSNSSVGTLIETEGGGGGGYSAHTDTTLLQFACSAAGGGSGGGSGQYYSGGPYPGKGSRGQGYDGGFFGAGGGHYIGGGGGGAGGTATAAGGAGYANGGIGMISTIITPSIATANSVGEVSGTDVYYGGGGAGEAYISTYNGTGGLGGGGNIAVAGAANTGGGGGASTGTPAAADGGSGVVIIRVAV